jgi:uncharacterized RDD family membrane protein YckC
MDQTPDLAVESATGVDVALPVAGPGVRAFAFLIDWHIRTIVAIAWYIVAAFIYNRGASVSAPLNANASWFVGVVTAPAVIYFLYHPVLEIAMRGRTPGKRMAGVHIVTSNGGAPGVGSLAVRNVFRLVDSFPLAYAVGLVATMLTRNYVRVGDLAAGTLLVYVRATTTLADFPSARPPGLQLDTARAELISELLQRWPQLDADARRRLAISILGASATGTPDDITLRIQLEHLSGAAGSGGGVP